MARTGRPMDDLTWDDSTTLRLGVALGVRSPDLAIERAFWPAISGW